jgi:hypothetical protein
MPESKHMKWDQGFGTDAEQDPKAKDTTVAVNEPAANDADGWQQYRRWISRPVIVFLERLPGLDGPGAPQLVKRF